MRSMIGASYNTLQEANVSVGSLRFGDTVSFYHDVPQILHRLRSENIVIAACSRTTATVLWVISGSPRCYSSNIPTKSSASALSIAHASKSGGCQFTGHACYQVI